MIFLSTLIASVLLTALTVPIFSRLALRYDLVDLPNDRKVHTQPIPRVGGLAMALGTFVPIVYWGVGDRFVAAYLAGALVLLLFGLLDDYCDLSPRWKLVGQAIAALVAVYGGGIQITHLGQLAPDGFLLPVWLALPLTVLVIVGVTNAINLSDGLDGLAGGISLLCLCFISYLAYIEGDSTIALISMALCGAIFGFLRFNSFPATIFMGDAGSQLLGFSAITLAMGLTQGNTALSPVLPLIILGFPVLDTLTVMAGRIARGRSPFSADKTHFHHSLLALGLHQTESVLVIYVIQVSLIVAAFVLRFYCDWLLLGGYLIFSGAVLLLFYVSRSLSWQPRRGGLVVRSKLHLRHLRDETRFITYIFRPLQVGLLGLLLLTVMLTGQTPGYVSVGAAVSIAALACVYICFPRRLEECLRVVLYLLIPVAVYFSSSMLESSGTLASVRLYRMLFVLLAVLNVLVSKFSRRSQAFKSSPLDFLILFLVLVIPGLPELNLRDHNLGMIAIKTIICYYSFEVVFAELRGELKRVALVIMVALVLLAMQGI